jgi:two-component system, LytTR family, response regulator
MIKTLIIENEKKQSDYLEEMLAKHFPEIVILKVCNSVPEGIKECIELQPQLLFLDVHLPPYNGFHLLEETRNVPYKVIFTTAYNEHAVRAFRFCALDFIEKPFGKDELTEAINRYRAITQTDTGKNIDALLHNVKQTVPSMQKVGIPVMGGIDFLTVSDIIYCKSEDNCTDFFLTSKKKILATKTLKSVEELMKEHGFFRVHDSYLINLNHIIKYKKGGEGGVVALTNNHEIDVARRRKDSFLQVLTTLNMIFNR